MRTLLFLFLSLFSFSMIAEKPVVVLFAPPDCARCTQFEQFTLPHPTILRRLPKVAVSIRPTGGTDPSLAFIDCAGIERARWPMVPDTMQLGIIIDSVLAVAPHFERAAELAESGLSAEGELEAAIGLSKLTRAAAAREALARAHAGGNRETQQLATVLGAILDANERQPDAALSALQSVLADPATPKVAAEAQKVIDTIRPSARVAVESRPIRVLPLQQQVVSGSQRVKVHIRSAAVARVSFSLDHREVERVERPPFSAMLDFGAVPQRHVIGVTAFDRSGNEIGRDVRVVNEGGELFWLRLITPREGPADGAVSVTMDVRVPATQAVKRVVVTWNGARRATLTSAPWTTVIRIPPREIGVLSAEAELDDGRTSEDAVLLNALGGADQADVHLVELPVTIVPREGTPELTASDIMIREANKPRKVEAIATADETPLTVGVLIDVSESMEKTLPDLQEAAIRFLETILGERDRAFLVTFDDRARLLQSATGDVASLRRQIMTIRPEGLTALHDAMVLGLLQFEGVKGRRAMVVFTDGLDRTSGYSASDVGELARRVHVPIHFIASVPGVAAALNGSAGSGWTKEAAEHEVLKRVATETGGTAQTLDDMAALREVYARIEAALRAQVLVFMRTEPATRANEWRSITVKVRGHDAYAPVGYYASW